MSVDIINIFENARNTIAVVLENDLSKSDSRLDEKLIKAQKSALNSSVSVMTNIIDEWPGKREEIMKYFDTYEGKMTKMMIYEGMFYCLEVGYLDLARMYLNLLIN